MGLSFLGLFLAPSVFPEEDPDVAEKSMTLSLYRFGDCGPLLPGSVPGSVRVSGGGPWRGGEIL